MTLYDCDNMRGVHVLYLPMLVEGHVDIGFLEVVSLDAADEAGVVQLLISLILHLSQLSESLYNNSEENVSQCSQYYKIEGQVEDHSGAKGGTQLMINTIFPT